MSLKSSWVWMICLSLLVFSCKDSDQMKIASQSNPLIASVDTAKYQIKVFTEQYGDCDSLNQNCVSARLQFPDIIYAANHHAKDSLNVYIRKLILAPVFEGKRPKKPEDVLDQLVDEYESFKSDFPGNHLSWKLERTVAVIYNTPKVLSLLFDELSFTGGAHANSIRFHYHFDMNSGNSLQLSNIFIEGFQNKLDSIAEKKFRKLKNLKPDQDLHEAGFWFENNKFSVNNNFTITDNSIIFYFNPYEIAPYAEGPIQLELPYGQIKALIKNQQLFNRH